MDYPGRTNVNKRTLIEKVSQKCQAKVRCDYANKFRVIQLPVFKDGGWKSSAKEWGQPVGVWKAKK